VRDALCRTHANLAESAAELLTAELVTDALRHGALQIELTLDCQVAECLIEVVHRREGRTPHQPTTDLTWLLIDKIAREWGVHATQEMRELWATIPTGVAQSAAAHATAGADTRSVTGAHAPGTLMPR